MSEEELCGEPYTNKDGYCDNDPKYPDGKCGHHSKHNKDAYGGDDWKPNEKHGVHTNRSAYYHGLPEEDQAWIDAIVDSFLDDAPFDEESVGKLEKLRSVAIDMHKKRQADEHIQTKGMTQDKTVGYHEDHGEITAEEENVLHITADRLSRETRQTLKDLGVIGKDQEESGDASESLIEQLSKMDSDE